MAIGDFFSGLFGGPATLGKAATLEAGGASLGFASFATGTDFVPRDMLAKIHKGERIIPASENKGGAGKSLTVVQNFYHGMPTSAATQKQQALAAGRGVQEAIRRNG